MSNASDIPVAYQVVADAILSALEEGVVPWRKPWRSTVPGGHFNASSAKPYRGINQMLLDVAAWAGGYESPAWVTFRQAKFLGASVRKGERGHRIVFWKRAFPKGEIAAAKREDREAQSYPMLRYFTVFNAEQLKGADIDPDRAEREAAPWDPIADAELAAREMPMAPTIREGGGGNRCFYTPSQDVVRMAPREAFDRAEDYYGVLFHELAHATGHHSRLDRDTLGAAAAFGDAVYSREELVAEMGSAFVCRELGVQADLGNTAAYIEGWRSRIKADPKCLMWAAGRGAKAADWILGRREVG